jgi:hypothetical protein
LVWDVTVVDTLADSYVLKTSEVSGFAAEMACKRKHNKYSSIISSNYIFKGLAFETLGPWCKAVAARQDQNQVGTSNFFGQSLGQFFRVIFFFLTLHQLNSGDGYT